MSDLRIRQIQFETETWKRVLYYLMDENSLLKNRLSEVLKDASLNSFLNNAEQFQTRFLSLDEDISFLRHHLANLEKLFIKSSNMDDKIMEMMSHLEAVQKNMIHVEIEFSQLRYDFNQSLMNHYTVLMSSTDQEQKLTDNKEFKKI